MSYLDDHDGDYDEPESKTCNRCGKSGLWWVHTGVRWALIDEDTKELHVCNQATVNDFEDLT